MAEPDLTLKKAMEIAVAFEAAVRNVQDLKSQNPGSGAQAQKVFKVSAGTPQSRRYLHLNCFRCGGKHEPEGCKYKDAECYYCHQVGHIASKCPSKRQSSSQKQSRNVQHKSGQKDTKGIPGKGNLRKSQHKSYFMGSEHTEDNSVRDDEPEASV